MLLRRASEIAKNPVVTLDGEDIAQIKDLVYESSAGAIAGFTLAGRGLLAGPMKEGLPWSAVLACGRSAVMVQDATALVPMADVVSHSDSKDRKVLDSRVITDTGVDLGKIVDVIIEVSSRGTSADVLGYEIEASAALSADGQNEGRRVLIPLPDTLAVSGEALMVPAGAIDFVTDDLAGFGVAVERFRAHLKGEK